MISFVFKTVFWVGVVWVFIGKPLEIQNSAHFNVTQAVQTASTSVSEMASTARTVKQVCAIVTNHPACQTINAAQKEINSIAPNFEPQMSADRTDGSTPVPPKRPTKMTVGAL